MSYRKILVAYDKSDQARQAVDAAIGLAQGVADAEIHVISIMPSMEETYAVGGLDNEFTGTNPGVVFDSDILGNLQDVAAERELTEIKTQLSGAVAAAPCPLMIEIAYGTSPTTGILAYADSNECDVIVMGCRGLGALRGMIGSVSFAVLRSATVPVLIVK